ncbi:MULTISPECIES: hypothetical protein [Burkholderia]|uniref:SMI1/KNR4 family protein n=1 Tax=Burkholderia paludis TaxID=1506587 RepID=A0A6J5EW54_9BURK|nr:MULTISPECIES: hypothetical protein [Burkholderia]CAB3770809.1 hypothetical protein LMG30113_06315 [Burkholderia paludis]VWC39927.1 hypothetical protein BPA30113_06836 [Burkholderia paludis]
MTITDNVYAHLAKQTGNVERDDPQAVLGALDRLGIARDTDFAVFYLAYQGPFTSPRPVAELWDLLDYSGIVESLDYVRDRYAFADHLLPLTSDESEGMYLYDTLSGAVHDYDLGTHASFMAGEIDARWATFSAFLAWYFDEAVEG